MSKTLLHQFLGPLIVANRKVGLHFRQDGSVVESDDQRIGPSRFVIRITVIDCAFHMLAIVLRFDLDPPLLCHINERPQQISHRHMLIVEEVLFDFSPEISIVLAMEDDSHVLKAVALAQSSECGGYFDLHGPYVPLSPFPVHLIGVADLDRHSSHAQHLAL